MSDIDCPVAIKCERYDPDNREFIVRSAGGSALRIPSALAEHMALQVQEPVGVGMRNITLTDAEAGEIHDLLRGMRGLPNGTVREINTLEEGGWNMNDGSPMPQSKIDDLTARRQSAQTRSERITHLMSKFLRSR
jgi:antitoxin component of MazEF toxin-antitoxin module